MTSALKKLTEAEYLRTEESSPFKREYVEGFVYPLHAQAGTKGKHGVIALNIATFLYRPARQKGCQIYASDLRVRIHGGLRYYYPDVLVTCEDVPDDALYAEAPCLLAEVLSDSTRATDLGDKVRAYQELPSLQGYLLVDTEHRAVRLHRREAGGDWSEHYWEGQGQVDLPCIGVQISLDDLYEGTRVPPLP